LFKELDAKVTAAPVALLQQSGLQLHHSSQFGRQVQHPQVQSENHSQQLYIEPPSQQHPDGPRSMHESTQPFLCCLSVFNLPANNPAPVRTITLGAPAETALPKVEQAKKQEAAIAIILVMYFYLLK
jgi:hypothetical protein